MKSTRRRPAPLWAGLALAAAVAVTGCATSTGSSGSPGSSASQIEDTPTATASIQLPTDASASTDPTFAPTGGLSSSPSGGAPTDTGAPTSADSPQPPVSADTTATDASTPRCHTSDLMAVIEGRGGAAGTLSAQILLTNHSDHACAVYGYGGMQLYAADGSKAPTNMVRDPATPPVRVVLDPGDHAYSALKWSDVPHADDPSSATACQPQATIAHITPPDETDYLNAHWGGSPVCNQGRIDQGAYRAGSMPQQ